MRHKKILIFIVVVFIAVFGFLLPGIYEANGSDRMVLHFLREIPLDAQKYTLTGESESWSVNCNRYDGIIFLVPKAEKSLLQDITLTLDYKGAPKTVTENMPVTFSMEVDSMFSDHLRQLSGEDMLSPGTEFGTIWYSSAIYPEGAPANRLPLIEEELSIAITMDGKTEVVVLRTADPAE